MEIKGDTKVLGIIGYPVDHSLSPVIHNAAFEELKLSCVYVPFPVKPENLKEAIEGIRALNVGGVNVTIPHKVKVMNYLDEISKEAAVIGAVNTIVNKGGRLVGFNTDASGFKDALYRIAGVDLTGKRVLVLGAGGAARAVVGQCLLSGASSIIVSNRTKTRAKELEFHFKKAGMGSKISIIEWGKQPWRRVASRVDIIANTAGAGQKDDLGLELEIPWDDLDKNTVFFDAVYGSGSTRLLKEAQSRGHLTVPGKYMLLYQGVEAFKLWTGLDAPLEVMEAALDRFLKG
ncbi:shikimate dehydrogenase [Thermosediminibacter oceani]|uniref:Shikimate dehydrogenase (NADP(+)) n=1 Tax=Thermosediminibacter oceani (strain ATCC BAA-1034 / DSM 16646 / JW/IW-1228P) TaxID=555079 RepID=D9RXZ0_THEOJ|nr:shikimate dehydrogenase [Thermosediminibacter oceani]ADL08214.1 shikimate 5-dehydrogenase [Thermosediminibacter oceani DSM 16646]